jgi:hypothetical protein
MHVDPTRLAVVLFILQWWPLILAVLLAGLGYGVYRFVRMFRKPPQHCPRCRFTMSGLAYCVNCPHPKDAEK